jgi:NADPH:quinone reductase-like Zn-dependent oxidoreductase
MLTHSHTPRQPLNRVLGRQLSWRTCPHPQPAATAAMERSYSPGYTGYGSAGPQRYALKALPSEPPSGGIFYGQTCLVTGGGGIVGHALIGRILREGGTVIAVRARARVRRCAPAPLRACATSP